MLRGSFLCFYKGLCFSLPRCITIIDRLWLNKGPPWNALGVSGPPALHLPLGAGGRGGHALRYPPRLGLGTTNVAVSCGQVVGRPPADC